MTTADSWGEAYTAVNELLARYCHAIDTGNGAGLAECFARDASLEVDGSVIASGVEQIVLELTGRARSTVMHFSSSPSIVVDPNDASVRWRSYFFSVDTISGSQRSIGVCTDAVLLRPAGGSKFQSRAIQFRWRAG